MPRLDHDRELERALEFDEPYFCQGKAKLAQLEIAFADGTATLGRADAFVDDLLARSEPAPFGDGKGTRTDANVRKAARVKERGKARVAGFDPKSILEEIERVLSPRWHLEAKLTDVLVYGTGGHFASHRDTPMEPEMIGTLVVALPIAFEGGAFVFDDGSGRNTIDLRAQKGTVRWVAFFGDVDHVVEPVRSGHRVTLTYRLARTKKKRAESDGRAAPFGKALEAALADPAWLTEGGNLCVPCARRVIVAKGKPSASIEALRDTDRDIADAARALALEVDVVPFVAAAHEPRARSKWLDADDYARLQRPLTAAETRVLDAVTFAERASSDEMDIEATSLADAIAQGTDDVVVLARSAAQATLVAEGPFSATGYFGNEYYDATIYAFVALRIVVPSAVARGVAKPPKAAPARARARVRHAKFGEGEVLAEEGAGDAAMVTVQFADGTKKLLKRFVTPVA